MKLTIESDEGVKKEFIFGTCSKCPLLDNEGWVCCIDRTICPSNKIAHDCPFKKKEKKIKICCDSMEWPIKDGVLSYVDGCNSFIYKTSGGTTLVFRWCPWCGKKIELE